MTTTSFEEVNQVQVRFLMYERTVNDNLNGLRVGQEFVNPDDRRPCYSHGAQVLNVVFCHRRTLVRCNSGLMALGLVSLRLMAQGFRP